MPPVKPREPITPQEQLRRWVDGDPVHTIDPDQCCPDFSCCQPHLLADVEIRRAFAAASDQDRYGLLLGFLGSLIQSDPELSKKNIEIVGTDRAERS